MFIGIAAQLTEAQKEIVWQESQGEFIDMLNVESKIEQRKQKKIQTALSKLSILKVDQSTWSKAGLKSFFYAVFESQEQEKEKPRQKFLQNMLLSKANEQALELLKKEKEQLTPGIKPKKELRDLSKLVKKIKMGTQKKYDSPEVGTMMQFIDQTAALEIDRVLLDKSMELGKEIRQRLAGIARALRLEENWGSWELFFSKKVDVTNIPPSGIDEAFKEVMDIDVLIRFFHFYVRNYFDNRDMTLHADNLKSFVDDFVHSMLIDWMYESKVKASLSKISQLINSVDMLLFGLNTLSVRNRNELSLSQTELSARVARVGSTISEMESKK